MTQPAVFEALERLFRLAESYSGQSRRAANFLLAWWNATDNGGFDLADLFGVDQAVAADMGLVFLYLGGHEGAIYPDQLGYEDRIIASGRALAFGRARRGLKAVAVGKSA